MAHTPGPWKADTDRQVAGCNGDIAITRNGEMVAVAYVRSIGGKDETLPNAHLIAAAPEMLEMLRDVAGYLRGLKAMTGRGADMLDAVNAVIAKAEGWR